MNRTVVLGLSVVGTIALLVFASTRLWESQNKGAAATRHAAAVHSPASREPRVAVRMSSINEEEFQAQQRHHKLRENAVQSIALPPGQERDEALRKASQAWGQAEPEIALAWASAQPNGVDRSSATAGVCYGLASVDPEAAVHLAEKAQIREGGILENLAFRWAEKDITAATVWVTQQPGSPSRDQLIQRIAFVQARTDPAAAANLVLAQIPPGDEQTEAVISVVSQWARNDGPKAKAWVAKFPADPVRQRAAQEIAGASSQ